MFILGLFALLTVPTFAQTHSTAKTTVKPAVQKDSRPLLEIAREKATKDLAEVTALFNQEILKVKDYDACKIEQLEMQQSYDQWFVDHYSEFEAVSQKIDTVFSNANLTIASLKDQNIKVLPLPGQASGEVDVNLATMIDYFQIFNGRIQACTPNAKETLIGQMDNPKYNKLHVAHSQVVTAMQEMSKNMNASLKERDATYEIAFSPATCGYNLELRVKLHVNGVAQNYNFSLLESGGTDLAKIELGDEAKWSALAKTRLLVDKMPIDGMKRYQQFQSKQKGSCADLAKIPSNRSNLPFLTYAELTAMIAEIKKSGMQDMVDAVEMDFVEVQPGTFQMGSPPTEFDRYSDETPHQVSISKAFEIQITEVTQKQWFDVMKANPSAFKSKTDCPESYTADNGGMCPNNPVEQVSWNNAQNFIKKLNDQNDGYTYRLPTEAEWEYAARGGSAQLSTTAYSYGNDVNALKDYAWFDASSGNQTHEVGKKLKNSLGLFDIQGNVWEWVQDWYGTYTNTSGTQTDPTVNSGSSIEEHIYRGGSFGNNARNQRLANRYGKTPDFTDKSLGFRLVRTSR